MLDSRFGWVLRAARENPMRVEALGFSPHPYRLAAFPTLTVEENLVATASNRSATWGDPASRWTLDRVWTLFPHLRARRRNLGDRLSGGEQQMLAIGRVLMTNPGLLLLDEAMDGLAPVIRAEIWAVLAALKASPSCLSTRVYRPCCAWPTGSRPSRKAARSGPAPAPN